MNDRFLRRPARPGLHEAGPPGGDGDGRSGCAARRIHRAAGPRLPLGRPGPRHLRRDGAGPARGGVGGPGALGGPPLHGPGRGRDRRRPARLRPGERRGHRRLLRPRLRPGRALPGPAAGQGQPERGGAALRQHPRDLPGRPGRDAGGGRAHTARPALTWSRLAYATFDPELAALSGVPVAALEHLLLVLTALVVVVGVKTVGVILVSAFIVIPAATATLLARSLAGIGALAVF